MKHLRNYNYARPVRGFQSVDLSPNKIGTPIHELIVWQKKSTRAN